MDIQEFQDLITKYQEGKCNASEELFIDRWYRQYREDKAKIPEEDEIEIARLQILQDLPPAVVVKNQDYHFL